MNWGANHVRPECCTEHLREVLFFTADLLASHDIPHWLDYGALLGAARSESFIPWDDDVDLGVLAADQDRILALKKEIAAAGYHLDTRRPGEARINYSRVNSAGVDLFMWARRGDQLVSTFSDGLDWPGRGGASSFSASCVEPCGEVRLYQRMFPAPQPVDEFLCHRYGPDYMTPFRGVRSGSRWFPSLTPEELTPTAAALFERISEYEVLLLDRLYRSRLSRLLPWQLYWVDSALPRVPAKWALAKAQEDIASADRTPAVETLIRSLALAQQTLAEHDHPPRGITLRRAARRGVWLRGKVMKHLTNRDSATVRDGASTPEVAR